MGDHICLQICNSWVQTIVCSIGRQSERIANDYITYARKARRIKRQLRFNDRCRDLVLSCSSTTRDFDIPFTNSNKLYLQFYQILVRLLLINELTKPLDSITYRQNLNSPDKTKTKRHKNWFKNTSSRPLKMKRNTPISLRTETFYYTETYTDRKYCSKITRIHQGQRKEQNRFYSTISFPYQLQFN